MVALPYVGAPAANPTDIVNRLRANTLLTSGPVNRTGVSSEIHSTATTTYASKNFIDAADSTFALPAYYQAQDALNLPLTAVGQPNGAATLDANGQVPLAQMPALGAGYLLGPYGPTSNPVRSVAGGSPLDVVDFNIGVKNIVFQPLFFASVLATTVSRGRAVLEARMSNGPALYGAQTLIASGMGDTLYTDLQAIALKPTGTPGVTPSSYPATYNIFISLWLFDLYQSTTVDTTGIVSASVYLLRTSE